MKNIPKSSEPVMSAQAAHAFRVCGFPTAGLDRTPRIPIDQRHADLEACALKLWHIVARDFMPQIARMTCQDYGELNDACLLAEKLFPGEAKKVRKLS